MNHLLSPREVAETLGVHYQTVLRNPLLPRVKVGRTVRFKASDMEKFIESRTIRPSPMVADRDIIVVRGDDMKRGRYKRRYNFGAGSIFVRRDKSGNSRYYLDYVQPDGHRVQKVIQQAMTIEDAINELKKALGNPTQKETTVRKFADTYLNDYAKVTKRSWRADESRLKNVREFFGDTDLRDITPMTIERFRAWRLKEGNTKISTNRYLALLKRMLNIAISEKYLESNPVKSVKFFSEKESLRERILTPTEELRLIALTPDYLRDMIIIALNTGLRRGEIMNLKWSAVDLSTMLLRIEYTKSGRYRYVPINHVCHEVLLGLSPSRDGYVFTNPQTGGRYKDIKRSYQKATKAAGIAGLRFHDLRHTFATRLVQAGVDIDTLRCILGHRDLSTTQRYVHSGQDMARRAVDLLVSESAESIMPESKTIN